MKIELGVFALCALMLLPCDAAEENRREYKCYLETNQGLKVLHFSWYPSHSQRYIAGLPGTRLPDSHLNKPFPLYAKSVIECVRLPNIFSDSQARALDQALANSG